ncbi:MAG: SH3 domain-containing protein [Planctomycetota bacterium]
MRGLFLSTLVLFLATVVAFAQGAERGADLGAQRWRTGDRDGAVSAWAAALDADGVDLPPAERARLAYNLGVAEFERGEPLRATAWFEAALRVAPRFDDAAANLELARAEAGLGPRRADDLTATLDAAAASFTRPEAEWLALAGALLLALVAAGEALRGGGWRRAMGLAFLVQPFFFAPLARHVLVADAQPYMVIDDEGASLLSAPSTSAKRLGSLDAGDIVEFVDELPGWTRVAVDGEDRWTRADALFALRL